MASQILLHGQVVTREAMVEFKKRYLAAVAAREGSFMLNGQVVLVAYAKYVVEYAENEMGVLK